MPIFYQISCSCGKVHEVSKTSAGSTVTCSCGATLEVPPLRELVQLPSIERADRNNTAEQLTTGSESGVRQQRLGLLIVLVVLAMVLGGFSLYYYYTRPRMPTANDLNIYGAWYLWQHMRTGIETPLAREDTMFLHQIDVAWRWITLLASLSGVCLLAAFGLLLAPVKKR